MKGKLGDLLSLIQREAGDENERRNLRDIAPRYWDIVANEELSRRSAAELLRIIREHLDLARSRRGDSPKIRIRQPGDSDVVVFEMVASDTPFIFDSISNLVYDSGYSVLLSNHPILWAKRDDRGRLTDIAALDRKAQQKTDYKAESFVRYELEPGANALPFAQLKKRVTETLANIRTVVNHWQAMRDKAVQLQQAYADPELPLKQRARRQACSFLGWIAANNLTFLSYVYHDLRRQNGKPFLVARPASRLGLKLESTPWEHIRDPEERQRVLESYLGSDRILTITKSTELSPVRRFVPMDYIAIKDYDRSGNPRGEHRFYGLMTRAAYNSRALDIPLLADRIQAVMDMAHFPPGSHNAKMLLQILETFPRDELFQSSAKKLFEVSMGVLSIEEHHRVRVFSRSDPFHRYFSILVYIPREHYSQQVREKVQTLVSAVLDAESCDFNIFFTDSRMARLHLNVRVHPKSPRDINNDALESMIEEITESWPEKLKNQLNEQYERKTARGLFNRYAGGFSQAYTSKTHAGKAAADIAALENLRQTGSPISVKIYRDVSHPEDRVELRCYFREQPLPLSDIQPRLSNLGLRLLLEDLYPVTASDGSQYWIQDFRAEVAVNINHVFWHDASHFEDTFSAIHQGLCDDDDFNRLVISADMGWREAALLRTYCRYLKQLGSNFEQAYLSKLLADHGSIARLLVDLFNTRFTPGLKNRETQYGKLSEQLDIALESVQSLDADRLFRSLRNLIGATLRTNYFQSPGGSVFALKVSPQDIPEAPLPRPLFEIWVHSPTFEAVHLRGGKVARGGLRWSDRPEDFRTEVLGLVKSQMVKNAVIVPVGAKGGFVCRQLPESGDRQQIQSEVINCYKSFIRAMLSLTDNRVGDRVSRPNKTVCHDDEDPYLVVAADKGTAAFSDIANSISEEFNFWIGDAFASGGSNGYDHKKMGITAKGGWEAVKRHFREQGRDIQKEPFTVAGIGDMAGDVFGNGMLLSKQTRLLAAFNHQHIFIDPDPDPALSWKERRRMFRLPRSSWEDYDRTTLSTGGGIYTRSSKSIRPSAQACEALDIADRAYTPDELIHALLKAPVDLLWNGGIGTYVKAEHESHLQVGDRANDNVRVNGNELRCKVVGEGGNLGMTQAGRIEYSLNGGRCNSDFIDNSAGVDSSDNEVNIKILLNALVEQDKITVDQRNTLLKDMTADVEYYVLRNNYLQTQSISMQMAQSHERLGEQSELIRILERDAGLDRKLETLPDEKAIQARRTAGLSLTRPELATLLSYAKIHINRQLLESSIPEDPYLSQELQLYFPERLGERYPKEITQHRLRREIICTVITNSLVNRMGSAFTHRLNDELGNTFEDIARAYTVARDLFDIRSLWHQIEGLDNKVPDALQTRMMVDVRRLIKHVTLWLINNKEPLSDISSVRKRYAPEVDYLSEHVEGTLSPYERERIRQRMRQYTDSGVPKAIARRVTLLKALFVSTDITWLKEQTGQPVPALAALYFKLAEMLQMTWVRRQIDQLQADSRWHALARHALRDDLYQRHRDLCAKVAAGIDARRGIDGQLKRWMQEHQVQTDYLNNLIAEVKTGQQVDYLSLSVILRQLGRLSA